MDYFKVSLLLVASFALAIHAGFIFNSNEENEEAQAFEKFLTEVQRTCRNNTGNDETFNNLVTSFTNVPVCIGSKMDVEGFLRDAPNLTNWNRFRFFNTYCPQINDSLSCLNSIVPELRKCLDHEKTEVVDVVAGVVPEALNLICKDKGEIFFNKDANFQMCLKNVMNFAESCSNKISNATEAMDLSNYGEKQCNEVAEVRSCFQSKVNECNAPRLMELFDTFYRPVVRVSPCAKYMQQAVNTSSDDEEDDRIEINQI